MKLKYCIINLLFSVILLFICPHIHAQSSPCDPNGIHPFCMDQNPYGITYSSGTSGDADDFFGGYGIGCLYSMPCPAYYYMKISSPGDLLIYIQQVAVGGYDLDVDFACWGPFTASSQQEFVQKLCSGQYSFSDPTDAMSHRPDNGYHNPNDPSSWGGYPYGNMVDCSYSAQGTEWCYIPNAQIGQFYLLLLTNYSQDAGTISFSTQGGNALTDCSLLAPVHNNGPLCEGATLQLTCDNYQIGATYSWVGPNGFTSNQQNPTIPNATSNMSGTYTLTMTYNGETDVQTTEVVITSMPNVTINPAVAPICHDDAATLTASGATTYLWSTGETTASITVNPTENTTYTVTGTASGGCSATATAVVTVNNAALYTLPDTVCAGTTITVQPADANATYVWSNGQTGSTINPDVTETTTITVQITDANGCEGSASVVVNPSPIAGFIADHYEKEIENGVATINFIDQSSSAEFWSWNFADSQSGDDNYSTEQSPSHFYTRAGYYDVYQVVYNAAGCRDSLHRVIHIIHPFFFYVPSAFSPGRVDGLNDKFFPSGYGVSPDGYEMLIYNQWGQLLFKTNELFGGWDGQFQGKLSPFGLYVYKITIYDMEGNDYIYSGTVTLIR